MIWFASTITVLLSIVALLVAILWSVRRRRDVALTLHTTAGLEAMLPTLAGLALGAPVHGNRVQLLENGHFFEVLIERIGAARNAVHLETFLWKDGVLGRRLAAALAAQAQAGRQVRVLLDANGAKNIGRATLERMRMAGCEVVMFHMGTLRNVGLLNDRDHRKLVVIDGVEAFVGGHCIVDTWLGDAEDHLHNADLSVLVQGPIVGTLQAVFSENWVAESDTLFWGPQHFPAWNQRARSPCTRPTSSRKGRHLP